MSIKNSVRLIGHTGKEVEVINFDNGSLKATVTLATNDHYTNAKGEKVEETQWHNLVGVSRRKVKFCTLRIESIKRFCFNRLN